MDYSIVYNLILNKLKKTPVSLGPKITKDLGMKRRPKLGGFLGVKPNGGGGVTGGLPV